jgi:hypothetical protein
MPVCAPPIATLPAASSTAGVGETGAGGSGADDVGGGDADGGESGRGDAAAEALSSAALSPFSSRGPAAGGGIAPGLAAPGAALTAVPGNASAIVGGSAVAAARTAIEAARLVRERPDTTPRELRAALVGAADPDPRLPARGAGAGALRRQAQAAGITARTTPERRADPCPGTVACVRIVLRNESASPASLALALVLDRGTRATLPRPRVRIPAGGRREAEVDVAGAGPDGLASGRLVARREGRSAAVSHPFAIATAPPEPPPLGPLTVQRDGGRVNGVRFRLGAFERGDPLGRGTSVALTERLTLSLVRARGDRAVRRLTPPGGARQLLPAEYEYTLPAGALRGLRRGDYAFRAVARAPLGGAPATARSEPFGR